MSMSNEFAENNKDLRVYETYSKLVDINDVFLVVDDRQKVVDMWRDLGLNTFQVAPGDF